MTNWKIYFNRIRMSHKSADERENRITAQYADSFRDIDSQAGAFATPPMHEPWYLTADERGA